ncbi:imm11 family protein [Paenibacillus qinlingensis]|uniref:Immunity MXAN-0049 protein domain-containing protein n=1 Tax=Paenibacillus qinlingensis TaxID=1837343 RepID=A0ABU1P1Z2_9BACL|nr:DUF1629 domain-containing protein [Paenibacillus qinlingensis]MDR6553771.1 hypothetical protein [Paenibacillus qinlingensis]
MRIWRLGFKDSVYTYLNPDDYRKHIRDGFKGKPMKGDWKPIDVELIDKSTKLYDFTGFGTAQPILNKKVFDALDPLIHDKVEYLPIVYEADKLCFVNILNVLDCLDLNKAIVVRDEEYNIVTAIKKYAFQEQLVKDEVIFKLPYFRGTHYFVTEKFRDAVIEHGLTGFEFEEVWNSEEEENEDAPVIPPKFEGKAYKFVEALDMIEQGKQAIASDRYVLQNDDQNRTWLGILLNNGTYHWTIPVSFPPTFVEMDWYLIEKMKAE